MKMPAEKDLIGRAVRGDGQAFETLYQRHYPQVHHTVASRIRDGDDVRDLVQTVFVRAFGSLDTFRVDASFSTWLVRIAINACNSFHRSAWLRKVRLDQMEDPDSVLRAAAGPCVEDPECVYVRHEERGRVRDHISALATLYRTPMWLRHVEDRTYAEIARTLELPLGTVKTRLFRGFRALRSVLCQEDLPN